MEMEFLHFRNLEKLFEEQKSTCIVLMFTRCQGVIFAPVR